jgi:exodeoxyribonuclease VIII
MSSMFPPAAKMTTETVTGIDLMVDLETMGTRPTAPVVSIGAVLFDPRGHDTWEGLRKRAFLRLVDIEDAVKYGRVEGGTLKWWLSNPDAAIKRLVDGSQVALKTALNDLYLYAYDRSSASTLDEAHRDLPTTSFVWAKSPDFDMKILEEAALATGLRHPFFFANYRCVRTLQDLAWPDGPDSRPNFNEGVHHDAADDAVAQALMVQAGYQQLKLAPERAEFLK